VAIPLDKLIAYNGNRYIFTRSAMLLVDRLGNIKDYPEEDENWKVVPNILDLLLHDNLHFLMGETEHKQEQ
jgi:hypothetical protein